MSQLSGILWFSVFHVTQKTNSERLRNVTHCKQKEVNPHRCRVSSSLRPHYVLMVLITLCQIKLCVTLENLRICIMRILSVVEFVYLLYVALSLAATASSSFPPSTSIHFVHWLRCVGARQETFQNLIFIKWEYNLFLLGFCVTNACSSSELQRTLLCCLWLALFLSVAANTSYLLSLTRNYYQCQDELCDLMMGRNSRKQQQPHNKMRSSAK